MLSCTSSNKSTKGKNQSAPKFRYSIKWTDFVTWLSIGPLTLAISMDYIYNFRAAESGQLAVDLVREMERSGLSALPTQSWKVEESMYKYLQTHIEDLT